MHVFPQGLEYCQRILCINHTLNPRWVILCVIVYCFCIKIVLTSLCSPAHKMCYFFFYFFFVGGNTQGLAAEYATDPVLVFKNRQFCEDECRMSMQEKYRELLR